LYQLGAGSNIIDIIVRRVDTFPPEQLHVLIMASIIGVRFHFNMLLGLVDREESVVVEALNRAVRMQLIRSVSSEKERTDQFFHDKIREALYLKSPPEQRKSLHLRIARRIETMERARGERIYELAYHYDEGGDAPCAYKYAVEAGNLAREQFAYKEALKYFERASGLMDEGLPETYSTRERTILTEVLGDIHSMLGDYEKAIQFYKERLSYETTDLERASLERRIGKTYYRKAAYRESVDHLDRALAILGGRKYRSRLKIHGENFMRLVNHILRRVLCQSPMRTWPDSLSRDDIRKLELARIYRDLTYVYFFLDTEWMIVLFSRFLSLAEALKEPSLCGDAYCMLGLFYSGGMRLPRSGLRYMDASRAIRRALSDRWGLAQCTSWSGLSHLYRGELDEGHSLCREGRNLFDEIGDRWEFENVSVHLSLIHILRGEFSKAIECSKELEGRALEQGNYSGIVGAGWGVGVSYLHLGEPEKARAYIDRAIDISERAEQPFLRGIASGIDGLYHMHRKEFDLAIENLERATRILVETHFHGYYEFLLWIPLADAFLRRAETNKEDPGGIQADLKAARTLIRFGKLRAFPYPHYSGLLEILRGRERWLRRRYGAAERSFSRGIARLEATEASFLTATAHAEIGRLLLPRDSTKGRRHLKKAEKLLADTEAGGELAHVRFLLDEGHEDPSSLLNAAGAEGPTLQPRELEPSSTVLSRGVDFIARTGQWITATNDLEGLLEGILNLCIEAVGAERGCVAVFEISEEMDKGDGSKTSDDGERKPLIHFARSLDRSEIEWSRFQYGRSLFNHVAREGESVIVNDASSDDRFDLAEEVRHQELRSILCVPLKHCDEILGALYLDNRLLSRIFSPEHQMLVSVVADQAAMAIRNFLAQETIRSQGVEIDDLRKEIRDGTAFQGEDIAVEHDFEEIVGSSDEIKSVLRLIEKVAPLASTVLIRGESGTGKELVARAVHNLSTGKDRPMVKVNCAALPEGLLESELFGHERGAFTDAHRRKIGRFEVAKGGSIFLDEIGELSQKLQAKLLRVIQDGQFERVGGIESIKSDARIIAATNRNLEEAIGDGRFREDLFYRLNVLPIHVPPLRDRRGDIPLLITYFVNKLNRKFDRTFTGIEKSSMDAMLRYDWPGNVRELQNVIERAMILSEGSLLHVHGLVSEESSSPAGDLRFHGTYSEMIKEFKRKMIKDAIAVSGGNKSAAARRLGIDPTYLSRLIKQLDIE
ncbi:sigma 54-interacting transcriptional regulator, partial [Thermodesulfobacteriota bacterium]